MPQWGLVYNMPDCSKEAKLVADIKAEIAALQADPGGSGGPLHGNVQLIKAAQARLASAQAALNKCLNMATENNLQWGLIANGGITNHRIKTTFFFSGQAIDGSKRYECIPNPPNQLGSYTVHPIDSRHLNWSVSENYRTFVLNEMLGAGINVITMSSWGEAFLPCTSGWAAYAPMQTSTQSHDELFSAAVDTPILIMPLIESRGDWTFYNEFPTFDRRVAPGTVSQINELVNRYLKNTSHPEWSDKWLRFFADYAAKKWPLSGQQESGHLAISLRGDG